MIEEGSKVQHKDHGVGKVDFVKGDVVFVTFDNGDEGKIPLSELKELGLSKKKWAALIILNLQEN